MKNFIQKELKEAKFLLKFDEFNGVKKLSHKNVVIVESMILHNPRYANLYLEHSKTREKIKCLNNNINEDDLKFIIKDINKQNSTRASEKEISVLAKRIMQFNKKFGLISFLCKPDNNFSLINLLSRNIVIKKRKRSNFSLATKICQTLCFVLNEGNKFQDNFMKFDRVLKQNLPYYLRAYNLKVGEIMNKSEMCQFNKYKCSKNNNEEIALLDWIYKYKKYSIYMKMINKLLNISGNSISKNGLDHLIWYTYK